MERLPANAAAQIEHRRGGRQIVAESKGSRGTGAVARPLPGKRLIEFEKDRPEAGRGLEQAQIPLGGGVFKIGQQSLGPVLAKFIELAVQGIKYGRPGKGVVVRETALQLADCSAAIRDSRGGWLLNSASMPPPAIPLEAISFGNWPT